MARKKSRNTIELPDGQKTPKAIRAGRAHILAALEECGAPVHVEESELMLPESSFYDFMNELSEDERQTYLGYCSVAETLKTEHLDFNGNRAAAEANARIAGTFLSRIADAERDHAFRATQPLVVVRSNNSTLEARIEEESHYPEGKYREATARLKSAGIATWEPPEGMRDEWAEKYAEDGYSRAWSYYLLDEIEDDTLAGYADMLNDARKRTEGLVCMHAALQVLDDILDMDVSGYIAPIGDSGKMRDYFEKANTYRNFVISILGVAIGFSDDAAIYQLDRFADSFKQVSYPKVSRKRVDAVRGYATLRHFRTASSLLWVSHEIMGR